MQKIAKSPAETTLFRLVSALSPFAAIGGISAFILVAVVGFGKSGSWMTDYHWYYAGGSCFLNGSNMYDVGCFASTLKELSGVQALAGLPYPPHFAPFAVAVASLSLTASSYMFLAINIAVAFAMAYVVVDTERHTRGSGAGDMPLSYLWAVALIFGSSGVWGAVWLGQVSFIIALLIWVAFRLIDQGSVIIAGLLLAIISVKPQTAALLFFWILINGQFRVLIASTAIATLLSLYAFSQMGIVTALMGWVNGLAAYQHYPENMLGSATIMGLPSLMALFGITISLPFATAIGAAVLIYLRVSSKVPPFSPAALATVLLVQMTVFSRPVDTVLLAPVFALFWPSNRSHAYHLLFFFLMIAIMCFPQQLVSKLFPFAEALHFRTFPIALLAVIFARQMIAGSTRLECWKSDQRGLAKAPLT